VAGFEVHVGQLEIVELRECFVENCLLFLVEKDGVGASLSTKNNRPVTNLISIIIAVIKLVLFIMK
jgi:hypothetical protein